MRLLLVPVSQLKQDDTWYCAGLRASGSITCFARQRVRARASQGFVLDPARCAASPGSKINTNPIYRTPFIAVHTYALLGPALGAGPRRLCRFRAMDARSAT